MSAALQASASTAQDDTVIIKLCNKLQCAYQLVARESVPARQRLQTVLLESKEQEQRLCVIFSRTQMLQLDLLKQATQINYQVARALTQGFKQRLECEHLPALPQAYNLPCLYAEELRQLDTLYFESGRPDSLIALSQAEFQRLMQGSQPIHIAHWLPETSADRPTTDTQHILNLTQRRIEKRLDSAFEVPPLSMTAQKVLKLHANPDAHADELTAIIETDPALAAQVLSWAASPYYASPSKVRSIEDAIIRILGFDQVLNLALGLALGKTFTLPPSHAELSNNFWKHAVYNATLVEGLVRLMPYPQRPEPGLAYLAGLLHNFGTLLLAHFFPPYFTLVDEHQRINPHLTAATIEQELLGMTRESITATLMQHWQMPEELIVAVSQQHNPTYTGEHARYVHLVQLANVLLSQQGIAEYPSTVSAAQLYQQLQLEPSEVERVLEQILVAEHALRRLAEQMS